MHQINKNKIVYLVHLHQQAKKVTLVRCTKKKEGGTSQKSFLQENQNCDEVTVERKEKKVITIPEEGLTKEEEHYAIYRVIKKYKKSSKSLYYICSESVKVKLKLLHFKLCTSNMQLCINLSYKSLHMSVVLWKQVQVF